MLESRAVRILPANLAVLVVGLLDLITTLFWLMTGRAVEVNPLMAALFDVSIPLFILFKLSTLGAYVAVIEWYRRNRNPVFARVVGGITFWAYLGIYAVSFSVVNSPMLFG